METILVYFRGMLGYLLAALIGFALGGILFSYHLPKLVKGINVREVSEDHNPGTMNVIHHAGAPLGMLCLLCDMAKAFFPVFLSARLLDTSRLWFALVIAAPALGHAVAPFYHQNGGKAIASTFGSLLGLVPASYIVFLLAAIYVLFLRVFVIRPATRRSVVTFSVYCALTLLITFRTGQWAFFLGAVLLSAIVIAKFYLNAQALARESAGALSGEKFVEEIPTAGRQEP